MKPKRMILGLIPNNRCNLKCGYCYISQIPEREIDDSGFVYPIEHMINCLSVERLGGPCIVNLTGEGETMLQKDIVKLVYGLLEEGHYIELVTNLTVTKVLDDILKIPSKYLAHLEFKVSFHYEELNRLKILDKFFIDLDKVQKSPCSFTLELMPNDNLNDKIDEIKKLCIENVGANCQVTIGRADYTNDRGILTSLSDKEYFDLWQTFNSPMMRLKKQLLNVKRKEFCYAGDWTLYVNMFTGETSSCYDQPFRQNIFSNPEKPIKFKPVGCHCNVPYCINGHAHMSLDVIPGITEYNYCDIRNRQREDGTEWFSDEAKEFFSTKLSETNEEYSSLKKIVVNISWYFDMLKFILSNPNKLIKRIKLYIFRAKKNGKK